MATRLQSLSNSDDQPATHHRQPELEPQGLLPEVNLAGVRSPAARQHTGAGELAAAANSKSRRLRGFAGYAMLKQSEYTIEKRLGQGSFSYVSSASWNHRDEPTAIKKVRPRADFDDEGTRLDYDDIVETLRHELKILKMLGAHTHVVAVLGASGDGSAFAMPQARSLHPYTLTPDLICICVYVCILCSIEKELMGGSALSRHYLFIGS